MGPGLETLSTEGWFTRGKGQGHYLWETSPAATETSLELIMDAKIKIPYASHVKIIQCFMTYLWRKKLGKGADPLINIPVGISFGNL